MKFSYNICVTTTIVTELIASVTLSICQLSGKKKKMKTNRHAMNIENFQAVSSVYIFNPLVWGFIYLFLYDKKLEEKMLFI